MFGKVQWLFGFHAFGSVVARSVCFDRSTSTGANRVDLIGISQVRAQFHSASWNAPERLRGANGAGSGLLAALTGLHSTGTRSEK